MKNVDIMHELHRYFRSSAVIMKNMIKEGKSFHEGDNVHCSTFSNLEGYCVVVVLCSYSRQSD